jgi:hypothetical protein
MSVTALRPWRAVRARPDAEGRAFIGIEAARLTGYLPVELVRKDFRRGHEIGCGRFFWATCSRAAIRSAISLACSRSKASPRCCDRRRSRSSRSSARPNFPACSTPPADRDSPRGEEVRLPPAFGGLIAKIKSTRSRRRLGVLVELAGLPFRVVAPADKLEKIA